MYCVWKTKLRTSRFMLFSKLFSVMNLSSLLPFVSLIVNNLNSVRNEVEAGAHELVPFRSSWFGSIEKNRQIEETSNYAANNEILAEFSNVKPRKLKTKETFETRTEELKKTHDAAKKKKKKKRKRKKKPVPSARRFVKTTNAERDRESNMTDSIEVTKRTKPVDIIVHIKVSE